MFNFYSHKENLLLNNFKEKSLEKSFKVLGYKAAIKCQKGVIFKDIKNLFHSERNNTITNKLNLKKFHYLLITRIGIYRLSKCPKMFHL